jgi:hypothetical protein
MQVAAARIESANIAQGDFGVEWPCGAGVAGTHVAPPAAPPTRRNWRCKRLTGAAYCRSCHAGIVLAQQIREVRADKPSQAGLGTTLVALFGTTA